MSEGRYVYCPVQAQMGCDFAVCKRSAVGYAEVKLKNHSLGGVRATLYLALCDQHILIGTPVEREWVNASDA